MPILEIVKYGNSILTKKAEKITNLDRYIEELAQNMVQTMYAAPGIGLAAPQINESKRLITADLSVGENSQNLIILINPELISLEGEVVNQEGCLSIPDINENVARPYRVIVKGVDLKGNEKTVEAEGLLARVLCHEIDHINGKLFIDHLSRLKKSLIKKKLRKAIEAGKIG
jgi:peptide deformylase